MGSAGGRPCRTPGGDRRGFVQQERGYGCKRSAVVRDRHSRRHDGLPRKSAFGQVGLPNRLADLCLAALRRSAQEDGRFTVAVRQNSAPSALALDQAFMSAYQKHEAGSDEPAGHRDAQADRATLLRGYRTAHRALFGNGAMRSARGSPVARPSAPASPAMCARPCPAADPDRSTPCTKSVSVGFRGDDARSAKPRHGRHPYSSPAVYHLLCRRSPASDGRRLLETKLLISSACMYALAASNGSGSGRESRIESARRYQPLRFHDSPQIRAQPFVKFLGRYAVRLRRGTEPLGASRPTRSSADRTRVRPRHARGHRPSDRSASPAALRSPAGIVLRLLRRRGRRGAEQRASR